MKFNIEFVTGIVYISVMVAWACFYVGEESEPGVFGPDVPITLFIVLVFPFVLGFFAGRDRD